MIKHYAAVLSALSFEAKVTQSTRPNPFFRTETKHILGKTSGDVFWGGGNTVTQCAPDVKSFMPCIFINKSNIHVHTDGYKMRSYKNFYLKQIKSILIHLIEMFVQ